MMDISIVTDSTADIPSDLIEKYQIQVIPNLIMIDGASLQDGIGISRQEFYQRLPWLDPPPTTATASSGVYSETYERLFRQGARYILSMHPSARLSGILNAASSAAQAFGEKVHVLDSGQVSLGLGFQVLAAAEAIYQDASLDNVLRRIKDVGNRVHLVAMLDTLEYVRRSGRVSWARARLGNLFQIKPFIELKEGVVFSLGESRTRAKGCLRLKEFLSRLGSLERLAILHTNAEQDARQFLAELQLNLPLPPLIINVTTVIGNHVGPNGLGFVAVIC
jgi:DegV family protein with EDD domain